MFKIPRDFSNLWNLEDQNFKSSKLWKNPRDLDSFEGVREMFRNSGCLVTPCCARRLDLTQRGKFAKTRKGSEAFPTSDLRIP